jgi:hypothetical protein
LSFLFLADVYKTTASLLDQQQRQQDFPPIFDRSIDSTDLQAIVCVVHPQILRAAATP